MSNPLVFDQIENEWRKKDGDRHVQCRSSNGDDCISSAFGDDFHRNRWSSKKVNIDLFDGGSINEIAYDRMCRLVKNQRGSIEKSRK